MAERVDIYRFVEVGPDTVWTYTNADEEQTHDAGSGVETYTRVAIGRNEIEQKQEMTKADLQIKLDSSNPLAIQLLTAFSANIITLTIFTKQGVDVAVSWKGRLAQVMPGDTTVTLSFESIFTSMRRPGLRARFQRNCRHALYGRGCKLNPEDFAVLGTVSAIAGQVLTVPAASGQPDGYYTGGMVRDVSTALGFVVNHVGSSLTLQRLPYTLLQDFITNGAATAVTLYPGCDHTRATCWAKFNNGLRYGGFDWIPTKNPLGGSSIV